MPDHSLLLDPRVRRILVRGVNWLGDAVMTTPALQRLREANTQTHVTLLTPAKLAGLWEHHPAVDSVLTFAEGESVFSVGRRLRQQRFDLALVFPNSPRSALETFLARIPRRVGFARSWRNCFLTHRVLSPLDFVPTRKRSDAEIRRRVDTQPAAGRETYPASAHQLHHYLHLVGAIGASTAITAPRLFVSDNEVAVIRQRFELACGNDRHTPLLGVNAGAEYGPAKRWPAERYIEAAVLLQRQYGCHCWVFGGQADRDMAGNITRQIESAKAGPPESVRNLAGATTLRELCAALKACDVVLTNDTGPMHLAAAVGTSVVAPFGSTSPELTGPGLPGHPDHVLLPGPAPCAPCFRRECPIDLRCLKNITVERVVEAARGFLQNSTAP